jgi:hypothetical protein
LGFLGSLHFGRKEVSAECGHADCGDDGDPQGEEKGSGIEK